MFLYELAEEIQKLGFEAYRIILKQNQNGSFFVSTDEKRFILLENDTLEKLVSPKNTIIIHGENLHHKYFDKFKVARYYLNKIGALKNIGVPRVDEFKVAWNSSYVDRPDFVLSRAKIKKPATKMIHFDQPRSIDLTYIGKGKLYNTQIGRLPGTIELTRSWPNNVDEYLLLLSKARFLFTYDVISNVVTEAIAYGAVPVIMTYQPLANLQMLKNTYDPGVFKCCMLAEDFEKLDGDSLSSFFKQFRKDRKFVCDEFDRSNINFQQRLRDLLRALLTRFGPSTLTTDCKNTDNQALNWYDNKKQTVTNFGY